MERNNKSYGFTIALYEYERTIESLWSTVIDFAKLYPQHIAEGNSLGFLVDSNTGEVQGSKYNRCHFWSNFEIASLNLWRSQAYSDVSFDFASALPYRFIPCSIHRFVPSLVIPLLMRRSRNSSSTIWTERSISSTSVGVRASSRHYESLLTYLTRQGMLQCIR